jgi:hypothetical protein
MINQLTLPAPPKSLVLYCQSSGDLDETIDCVWNEDLVRGILYLFMSLLSDDHALLHQVSFLK